jgi:hypothetical protein
MLIKWLSSALFDLNLTIIIIIIIIIIQVNLSLTALFDLNFLEFDNMPDPSTRSMTGMIIRRNRLSDPWLLSLVSLPNLNILGLTWLTDLRDLKHSVYS